MEGRDNVLCSATPPHSAQQGRSTAHYEAEAMGDNLVALITHGHMVREYEGKVFCFIEAGKDRATYASFDLQESA